MVSQGPKGNYLTLLKAVGESPTQYFVRSDGRILKEQSETGNTTYVSPIDKRLCKELK